MNRPGRSFYGAGDIAGHRRRDSYRGRVRPHGGGPDPDLRRARHHQHRPGCPGHPGRLPQLLAVHQGAHRCVRRAASHGAGDVHHRRGDPLGVHQAAARHRANIDDPAGHLRGGADHRRHPVQDLRSELRSDQRPVHELDRARLRLLHRVHLHLRVHHGGRPCRGAVRTAVPDQVRPQRPRHDAGRDRRAARRHRREPRRRADLRHRRRGDRGRRDGLRGDQLLQRQQRLRPDLAAAGHHHPRRHGLHRRRARRGRLHDHPGVGRDDLVPDLGGPGLLRRSGARAGDPPERLVRPDGGAGPVSTSTDQVSVPTDEALGTGRRDLVLKVAGLLVLAVIAIAFPKVYTDPAVTNYGVFALIYVTVASAWNIFSGNTGYISLGMAVFYGSGAYALGTMASAWHFNGASAFALLPLAGVVGAIIAVPFGLIALRVRRHTFIVVTIAVFFIFQLMAYNLSFTHGTVGMNAPFITWPASGFNTPFYYIALAIAAGTIAIAWLIRRSRFGLQLRAIRDDEDRARGLGVRTMRVKLWAFVISGAIAAMIGSVWFLYIGQVQPNTGFDPLFDLTIVLMAFLGGYGSIAGTVLGALIVVLFMPRGIVPTGGEWITRLRSRGRPAVIPATTIGGPKAAGSVSATSIGSGSSGGAR